MIGHCPWRSFTVVAGRAGGRRMVVWSCRPPSGVGRAGGRRRGDGSGGRSLSSSGCHI